jgi:crotonobetainyl-CoA:carnitine CoA-transferase CaiB-like acyl-CoA transferase
MRPLAGTVVLDLTHMLSGPFATMTLTDLGADTIKVEPIGQGEGTRALLADDPLHSIDGMGAYFLTLNRGKRSIAVDLKSDSGREIFHDMVRKADVVVDNFSPGVTERLGIDYARLAVINPRIISCSITGFGLTGPDAKRTSFDLVAQAMGGGMSITGESDGRALRAGIPIGDLGGGLFAVVGILAALQARHVTGRGQAVDISMLDCQVGLLNYMATMYMMSGQQPARLGNAHFAHVPYDTFTTTSRDLIICVLTDAQWNALVSIVGEPALSDSRFATRYGRLTNRADLLPVLNGALARDSCERWLSALSAKNIPCAPVNEFEHSLAEPQVQVRDMIVEVALPSGKKIRMPGNPVKMSGNSHASFSAPPRLGQHTRTVLKDMLNLDDAAIKVLLDRRIISDDAAPTNVDQRNGIPSEPIGIEK